MTEDFIAIYNEKLEERNRRIEAELEAETEEEYYDDSAICELRKKNRTRTRARTLASVRCACKIRFETCVRCACVRGLYGTCELRSQLRNFSKLSVIKTH